MTITQSNFQSAVLDSNLPVIVDFWATWCGPCKAIAPVLDELENEFQGRCKVAKVNVEDDAMLASQYHVTTLPTFLLFKYGVVVGQAIGLKSKKELKEMMML